MEKEWPEWQEKIKVCDILEAPEEVLPEDRTVPSTKGQIEKEPSWTRNKEGV